MSAVLIPCPKCGKALRLRDPKLLGRKGKCPKCGNRFVLEEPEEVELQLAESTGPAVGTSAKWVPESGPSAGAAPAVGAAPQAAPNVATAPSPPTDFAPIAPAVPEEAGVGRLQAIKKKNARNRNIAIGVGALSAMLVAGIVFAVQSKVDDDAPGKEKPKVDVEYKSKKEALREAVAEAEKVSPTHGDPIRLSYIPAGASIIIHLRPAELWKNGGREEELRYCLGPIAGEDTEKSIQELTRFEPAEIEELLICWILGPRGQPPEVATVVRTVEKRSKGELIDKFPGEQAEDFGRPVYFEEDVAYLIQDQRTIAIVPKDLASDMVEFAANGGPTADGIIELLEHTDRERHVTLVFQPYDLFLHHEVLFPEDAHTLIKLMVDWFGEDVETVAWSFHLGRAFYSDLMIRNRGSAKRVTTPTGVHDDMRKKLDELPADILWAVERMEPEQVGHRQIIGRFPAMTKVFTLALEGGIGDRFVQFSTMDRLSSRAAPNLTLGALLTWDESLRTDFSKEAPAPKQTGPKLPDSIAERLKLPIEIEFTRVPLYAAFDYIAEESHVKIEIDGDALKLSGYTKNMAQKHQLGLVPGIEAIKAIVSQYDAMCIVIDEKKKVVTVMTKPVAAQKGLTPYKFD